MLTVIAVWADTGRTDAKVVLYSVQCCTLHWTDNKLLSAAGSVAVLFIGIKESWRLARKILFLVLTMIREILTLLAIHHLEVA